MMPVTTQSIKNTSKPTVILREIKEKQASMSKRPKEKAIKEY